MFSILVDSLISVLLPYFCHSVLASLSRHKTLGKWKESPVAKDSCCNRVTDDGLLTPEDQLPIPKGQLQNSQQREMSDI